ncbi:MAG: NYN domain-containing protein [Candidatus Poribacteria bacterium]|nr:NYN domain-containing protein [Candidatus Poribacteria bacterium]
MIQDCPTFKTCIAKHQLTWIIVDCLSKQELFTLAHRCNILHDVKPMSTVPKEWLANDLAAYFLSEPPAEKTVSQCLGQKAEQATRRIQYMSVEEIKGFLKDAEQLREDGEFGEILWALLVDFREDVQQHGYKLLAEHEQFLAHAASPVDSSFSVSASDDAQAPQPLEAEMATPNFPLEHGSDEDAPSEFVDTPTSASSNPTLHLHNALKQSEQQVAQLQQTISELRDERAVSQNENDKLKQKIEQLAEENQNLKDTERLYREEVLHSHELKRENEILKKDLEKLSDQLGEFHELHSEKDKFATELKSIEDTAARGQQALERMRLDFHSQFAYLQRINEEHKTALTRAKTQMTALAGPRNPGSGNRALVGQPRVGVFVDVQNMFYAAKDRYAGRLDYIKLLDLIVGPRNLVIAFAYVVQIPEINQSGFLSLLEHNGYTIKSKDLRMRGDGSAKGDWDVGIAIDVVSMIDALDVVILASGDGDFCALAELIKRQGKRIEVVAFEHNTSLDLQRIVDQFFPIGDELLI